MPDRRGALAAALLAVSVLTACSTSAPSPLQSESVSLADDQTLRVRVAEGPRTLDPALVTDERELAVVRQFSEPLLKPAPDLRDVQGAAAETYDISPDGLTWTFHLRANARYSDGQAVKAQDFVLAWRRLIDPRSQAPHGSIFAGFVRGGLEAQSLGPRADAGAVDAALSQLGIKAVDDLTLEITTPEPAGSLRWVATMPEGGPLRGDLLKAPGEVGNGPFHVTQSTSTRVTMAPNPDYWGGRPTLNRLEVDISASDSAGLTLFQTQQVGALTGVPDPLPARFTKNLRQVPELTTFWVDFNTGQAPFDNPRVRLAFTQSIDRGALVTDLFHGRAVPSTTLVPAGMRGYHPENGQAQAFNAGGAKALLDQSGVKSDQLNGLVMITRDDQVSRDLAGALAGQLNRALGVTFNVQALKTADYNKRLQAGDFSLAGPEGWTADYPDEQAFFDLFRSTDGNNGARWRNSRYDALVKQADVETSLDRRDQLFNQAEQLLVQDAPVAFLVQRYDPYLLQPYVRGVRSSSVDEWPGAAYSSLIYIAAH